MNKFPIKLTKKENAFLDLYLKEGNATLAALKVYNCSSYASASEVGSHILRKVKNPLKTFMEANGFSLKVLLSVLAGGLSATKLEDLSGAQVPDHSTRHKYLQTASKWLGIDSDTLVAQQININTEEAEPLVIIKHSNQEIDERSLSDEELESLAKETNSD